MNELQCKMLEYLFKQESTGTWRGRAVVHLIRIIKEHPYATPCELRKFVRMGYPFGPKRHTPYKIWGEVVRNAFNEASGLAAHKRAIQQDKDACLFTAPTHA